MLNKPNTTTMVTETALVSKENPAIDIASTKTTSSPIISSTSSKPRSDRTSMEGMLKHADKVLGKILNIDSDNNGKKYNSQGIPKNMFKKCKGICILSVVEAVSINKK
jgi:hypothetical protein